MNDRAKELQTEYRKRIEKYKQFGCDIEAERKFIIHKVYPLSGKILEIGTGKGYSTLVLAREGFCFVSVDISAEEQKIARLSLESLGLEKNVDFQIANAEKLKFENNLFDVVIAINVIHHFFNPYVAIDELMRVASLKGKIVLSDFTEEGFKLVDRIHRQDGKRHDQGNVGLKEIAKYLTGRKYSLDKFKSKFQEGIIVCR